MKNKIVNNNLVVLFIVLCTLYLSFNSAFALIENPTAYINEEVTYYYNTDGSVSYFIPPVGNVEVEVSNTHDVLQYLKLNLSNAELAYTNILSNTAYASVAASTSIGAKTRMLLNTDNGPKDVSYKITNSNIVPVIGLTFNYQNVDGGSDLSAGKTNTLRFNIFIDSTKDLNDVTLYFKIPININGSNDAANLYSPSVADGTITVYDSDGDKIDDSLVWRGNLTVAGLNLYVYADTTPGINFDDASYSLDLMCTSCVYAINYGPTFTGLSFSNLFSRGPINNGIYIMFQNETYVRGFMKNIARGLNYAVDGWKLYNISNFDTPIISDSTPFILYPNDMYNTDFYKVTNASEKYFTVAFDWGIIWNPSVYTGTTRSFIDLPTIYEGDISLGKSSTHSLSDNNVSVVVAGTYVGNENLEIRSVSINSIIPHQSEGGIVHVWDVIDWSDIVVYHINSSGNKTQIVVTEDMVVLQIPNATDDGFMYLNIDNISQKTGYYLTLNNDIQITYNLSTTPLDTQNIFSFNTTVIAKTLSGTPILRTIVENVTLYGEGIVSEPPSGGGSPGGAGGSPPPPERVIELVKAAVKLNLIDSNTADISGTYKLIDPEDIGINDMVILLDIPEDALIFNPQSIEIMRYDSKLGYWVDFDDKNIILEKDYAYVSGKVFFQININNYGVKGSGPILKDDDLLKISYVLTLPYGSYDLVLRAQIPVTTTSTQSGLKETDIHIPIRITNDVGLAESLIITESQFEVENIYVGISPVWTKTIEVHNPNAYSMSHTFDIEILPDFLNVNLTTAGTPIINSIKNVDGNLTVGWKETFKQNETKTYILNITTAPVIRTLENYTVLEATEENVRMLATVRLTNPSGTDYGNVTFLYIGDLDIIDVSDSDGNTLDFIVTDEATTIIVPLIKNNSSEYILIKYYDYSDVLVVSLDKLVYTPGDTKYNILYVPSRDEKTISISVEVLGSASSKAFTTTYADVIILENISRHNEVNIFDTLKFSPLSSGVHTIFVQVYSKDRLIGEDSETFTVSVDYDKNSYSINSYTLSILVILIMSLILLRIYKKRGFNDSLNALKRRLDTV
ncbi:MAG: hypothetical protein K0B07_01995 [DPANN group archaeon]|nr:hypothetical protein [DPANN group archaeon]